MGSSADAVGDSNTSLGSCAHPYNVGKSADISMVASSMLSACVSVCAYECACVQECVHVCIMCVWVSTNSPKTLFDWRGETKENIVESEGALSG